ncbi:MAG: tRNA (adenosine(37)-N6)-dimethylallyltransferase MiaA, partial [Clostridiaceae bacterium]|nr:tRNA (adenosine(37)-N6)-dimethylallyltransferase MiaA [Clostridiaceae bacterium]
VIVIVGPTASGKTKVSIELAKLINGEIISADSMQVYKYMDIGTAKPSIVEREGIEHFLIDEVFPDEEFNVVKFQKLAFEYIENILKKGKAPIVVGGTGLYINSLIYNIKFSESATDLKLREKLNKIALEKGSKYLHDRLKEIDPEAAARIPFNNTKRIIRAIEVFKTTNKTITYHQEMSRLEPPKYNYLLFGLSMDRELLYNRINKRVDYMLEKGLINEVKKLIDMGYHEKLTSMQGLGYKEFFWYFNGRTTLDESVYFLKRDTRHYAKRQITWFKRNKDIRWIDMNGNKDINEITKQIKNFI